MLGFWDFFEIGLSILNIFRKDGCLKVHKCQLEVVSDNVEGFVNEVQSTTLLLPIIAKNEVFLVCICQLENSGRTLLGTSGTSNQIVNRTFRSSKNKAFVGDPASTLDSLMEFFNKSERIFNPVFLFICPRL